MKKLLPAFFALLLVFLLWVPAAPAEGTDRILPEEKTVFFGTYPQTAEGTDRTPIEWIILDSDEDGALLLSKMALDSQPFNKVRTLEIYWDNCSLRKWLNDEFLNAAFTPEEQEALYYVTVSNDVSQGYTEAAPGRDPTKDRVFLLSYREIFELYLPDADLRLCRMTDYAEARGGDINEHYNKPTDEGWYPVLWWIRSPTHNAEYAAYVTFKDSVGSNFHNTAGVCVRPAIMIKLNADVFKNE